MAMDQEMLNWCCHHALPVHLLLTKRDKLSRSAAQNTLRAVQKQLVESPLFSAQLFSATKKEGVEEARAKIVQLLMSEPRPVNN
jgi:GTP-binding protein